MQSTLGLSVIISLSRMFDTVHVINITLTLIAFCLTVLFSTPSAGLDVLVGPVQEPHGQHQQARQTEQHQGRNGQVLQVLIDHLWTQQTYRRTEGLRSGCHRMKHENEQIKDVSCFVVGSLSIHRCINQI